MKIYLTNTCTPDNATQKETAGPNVESKLFQHLNLNCTTIALIV